VRAAERTGEAGRAAGGEERARLARGVRDARALLLRLRRAPGPRPRCLDAAPLGRPRRRPAAEAPARLAARLDCLFTLMFYDADKLSVSSYVQTDYCILECECFRFITEDNILTSVYSSLSIIIS